MLALSIRQPYAELILRGVKTVEYRSRPTRVIGERFYIYAPKRPWSVVSGQLPAEAAKRIWSHDLAAAAPGRAAEPPAWMLELAELLVTGKLPTGVIVGSAVIEKVTEGDGRFEWSSGT
jgi:predicted transcriptional regulator